VRVQRNALRGVGTLSNRGRQIMGKTQELPRNDDGTLVEFAWPGGYPVYYVVEDSGILCPNCARMSEREELGLQHDDDTFDPQWHIVAADINYEDDSLYCDHCGERIESAYCED
jgi:hypothetical protein